MRIVIVGDPHGHFDLMYEKAKALNPDVIVGLGDTGMFPNPEKADGASKRHGLPPDFLRYLRRERKVPVKTYFIAGNHEDFDFLEGVTEAGGEIVPGLIFVPQRTVLQLNGTSFGVLGGNYAPGYFNERQLSQGRRRHFTRTDIESIEREGFDVLISHDGPRTEKLPKGCQEITDLIARVRPTHAYHGHHHYDYETQIENTKVIGLDSVVGTYRSAILHED